ncbi:MAG: hypothetical protein IPF38_13715 [Burkholderiales bacterium]|nr:hypothetical protein [Burkholderiales bacterium]
MPDKKTATFKTIPKGTSVTWHYRSAIGHGTVTFGTNVTVPPFSFGPRGSNKLKEAYMASAASSPAKATSFRDQERVRPAIATVIACAAGDNFGQGAVA